MWLHIIINFDRDTWENHYILQSIRVENFPYFRKLCDILKMLKFVTSFSWRELKNNPLYLIYFCVYF